MTKTLEHSATTTSFNRWFIPIGAVAVHICIGSVYAWSTFNRPILTLFPDNPWWFSPPYTTFTTALVLLGLSAAFGGPWVDRRGAVFRHRSAHRRHRPGRASVAPRLRRHGAHRRHRLRPRLHLAGQHA